MQAARSCATATRRPLPAGSTRALATWARAPTSTGRRRRSRGCERVPRLELPRAVGCGPRTSCAAHAHSNASPVWVGTRIRNERHGWGALRYMALQQNSALLRCTPRRCPPLRRSDATVRTDVNGGINSREKLRRHDPALAVLLLGAYGDGPWRFTDVVSQVLPRVSIHCSRLTISEETRARVPSQLTLTMVHHRTAVPRGVSGSASPQRRCLPGAAARGAYAKRRSAAVRASRVLWSQWIQTRRARLATRQWPFRCGR